MFPTDRVRRTSDRSVYADCRGFAEYRGHPALALPATWTCPACSREVPERLDCCPFCGTPRTPRSYQTPRPYGSTVLGRSTGSGEALTCDCDRHRGPHRPHSARTPFWPCLCRWEAVEARR